jgi:hypothetical protein
MKDMKTRLFIITLLSAMTMSVLAQTFTPARVGSEQIQNQQIMQTGAYNGTVYEPFSNVAPSEYTSGNDSYSPAKAPSGPRKGFDIGGDTPAGPSPIGDAMLPLLLFAALFCGAIYLRRKRSAQKS